MKPAPALLSLQPCMHVFCAACYSGWMERSSLCPTCRCPVERIRKNHILNNLVEAYLLQHPGGLARSLGRKEETSAAPRKANLWFSPVRDREVSE